MTGKMIREKYCNFCLVSEKTLKCRGCFRNLVRLDP